MTARSLPLARTATALSRNPLGLLALCLIIGDGIPGMLLLYLGGLSGAERLLLCIFVVSYPLCLVAAIYRLVSRHHTRLYAPADFRDERCFLDVLALTGPSQAAPLTSTRVIAGEDFALIESAPAANCGPRREPGVYLCGTDVYYVTHRQQIFLLRRAGDTQLPREVRALPERCHLLPRQDWDRDLQALADAAERLAGA